MSETQQHPSKHRFSTCLNSWVSQFQFEYSIINSIPLTVRDAVPRTRRLHELSVHENSLRTEAGDRRYHKCRLLLRDLPLGWRDLRCRLTHFGREKLIAVGLVCMFCQNLFLKLFLKDFQFNSKSKILFKKLFVTKHPINPPHKYPLSFMVHYRRAMTKFLHLN